MRFLPIALAFFAGILGLTVVQMWLRTPSPQTLHVRTATQEGSVAEATAASQIKQVDLHGCFQRYPENTAGSTPATWLGFRGDQRNNIAHAQKGFATWPEKTLPLRWQIVLGDGHAMPTLVHGCLYVLDYDEGRHGDSLTCINADTGKTLWHHLYAVQTKRNHGISRTVTATDGSTVVSFGPQCHVLALCATNGAYRWGLDLAERYGSKVPLWYAGQCPLIDPDGVVILAPAGTNTLLCGIDSLTGKTVFETPNPDHWQMSHASVMTLDVQGHRQYIYAAIGGIVGIDAEGPERGKILWKTEAFAPSVVAPSPTPLTDGRFFMTAGYGSGGAMFKVVQSNKIWSVHTLFKTDKKQFACEQQTPIFHDGLLYTVMPSDGGGDRQQLVCMTVTGERVWASGKEDLFGLGPFVATQDGFFFLLNDAGTLTIARCSHAGYQRLARYDLMQKSGRDAWGPLIVAGNRIYLRDSTRLFCFNLNDAEMP